MRLSMGDVEPIEDLLEVAALMHAGELGEVGLRVARRFDVYFDQARDGMTLDQAAGVKPSGGARPWWLVAAQRRRNEALRELSRLFCNGRVESVKTEIDAYQRGQWGRDRDLPECPAAYRGTARELLFLAFRENVLAGRHMPTSIKQLRRILQPAQMGGLQSNCPTGDEAGREHVSFQGDSGPHLFVSRKMVSNSNRNRKGKDHAVGEDNSIAPKRRRREGRR